uniref:Outer membrane protein beta-barrel domain-containing protein n=1 Tax=viral metagenome TaxID=1070528 RepID=A0A6C0EIJ9_9ZZZZ
MNYTLTNVAMTNVAMTQGDAIVGIGDAITIKFQSGIVADTLLYGSIRISKWKNNQVSLPLPLPPPTQAVVTGFEDSKYYTLGIGHIINKNASVSITLANDPKTSTGNVSELSPTGDTRSISIGTKIRINDSMKLSIGGTYARISDVTTGVYNATLNNSSITSFGAKINYTF